MKPQTENTSANPSRRKLLKGAAVTGVFVSLAAGKPVFGSQTLCSPSGFHSGNLSGVEPTACNGKSPGYWKRHPGAWASCGVNPGYCNLKPNGQVANGDTIQYINPNDSQQTATKYSQVFGSGNSYYDNKYMMQYLREFHSQDPNVTKPMVWHLTAAYLNSTAGISGYVLTPQEVIEMYRQLVIQGRSGYTSPSGLTIPWAGSNGLEEFLNASYHDGVLV